MEPMDPSVFENHQACTFPTFDFGFVFFPKPPKDLFTDGLPLALPGDEGTRVMTMAELAAFLEMEEEGEEEI